MCLRNLFLLVLALILTSCGPSLETEVSKKNVDRSGWAPYDTTLGISRWGLLTTPLSGSIWSSDDHRLTLYRDSAVVRDSVRLSDSTVYSWRYHYRDCLRIRDSTRWHDRFVDIDTTQRVTYNTTWYEKWMIELFPALALITMVIIGIFVLKRT
jgi:hypothetical protein